jgi:heme-degrading monooxygenase HmoA
MRRRRDGPATEAPGGTHAEQPGGDHRECDERSEGNDRLPHRSIPSFIILQAEEREALIRAVCARAKAEKEDGMIARIWKGAVRAEDADAYLDYLQKTGFKEYRETPGNRGLLALRRAEGDRCGYILVTLWDSIEAVEAFAGGDIDRAVFYPEDERFLVERDETSSHHDVVVCTFDV